MICDMSAIVIVRPDESWPAQYEKTAEVIHGILGSTAVRVDHIGSTSVPRLPAKDILDIQATVATEARTGRGSPATRGS